LPCRVGIDAASGGRELVMSSRWTCRRPSFFSKWCRSAVGRGSRTNDYAAPQHDHYRQKRQQQKLLSALLLLFLLNGSSSPDATSRRTAVRCCTTAIAARSRLAWMRPRSTGG
jgi:hypothetical protein